MSAVAAGPASSIGSNGSRQHAADPMGAEEGVCWLELQLPIWCGTGQKATPSRRISSYRGNHDVHAGREAHAAGHHARLLHVGSRAPPLRRAGEECCEQQRRCRALHNDKESGTAAEPGRALQPAQLAASLPSLTGEQGVRRSQAAPSLHAEVASLHAESADRAAWPLGCRAAQAGRRAGWAVHCAGGAGRGRQRHHLQGTLPPPACTPAAAAPGAPASAGRAPRPPPRCKPPACPGRCGHALRRASASSPPSQPPTPCPQATTPDGRAVAIKALSLRGMRDWKQLELFQREAAVLQSLEHPSIPRYLGYFEEDSAADKAFYLVQVGGCGRRCRRRRRRCLCGGCAGEARLCWKRPGGSCRTQRPLAAGTCRCGAAPAACQPASARRPLTPPPLTLALQEVAEGVSLHQMVAAGKRASEAQLLRIARELLEVLQYLGSLRPPVTHRDVKPDNIVIEGGTWGGERPAPGRAGLAAAPWPLPCLCRVSAGRLMGLGPAPWRGSLPARAALLQGPAGQLAGVAQQGGAAGTRCAALPSPASPSPARPSAAAHAPLPRPAPAGRVLLVDFGGVQGKAAAADSLASTIVGADACPPRIPPPQY
jgi:serine/threonine protein kinase